MIAVVCVCVIVHSATIVVVDMRDDDKKGSRKQQIQLGFSE
jgi:hypothetical protein